MKVESKVTVIAVAAAAGMTAGCIAKLLANFQRMAAQCLGALPGVDRQQVCQHAQRQHDKSSGQKDGLAAGPALGSTDNAMAN